MKKALIAIISGTLIEIAFASSPDPILASPLPRIVLKEGYLPETLEFFRLKGTEELRRQTGDPTAILKFDYDFDPYKHRKIINYDETNTYFGAAFRDILDEQGLVVDVTARDRMRISEATGEK